MRVLYCAEERRGLYRDSTGSKPDQGAFSAPELKLMVPSFSLHLSKCVFEQFVVGARKLTDEVSVFEEHEGRYRLMGRATRWDRTQRRADSRRGGRRLSHLNPRLGSRRLVLVDIDFGEGDVRMRLAQLLVDRRDPLEMARAQGACVCA